MSLCVQWFMNTALIKRVECSRTLLSSSYGLRYTAISVQSYGKYIDTKYRSSYGLILAFT